MNTDLISDCKSWCKDNPKKVAFPDSNDQRVFEAVTALESNAWLKPVLVGNAQELKDSAKKFNFNIDNIEIFDPSNLSNIDTYAQIVYEKISARSKEYSIEKAKNQIIENNLWLSAAMLEAGDVDMVVAGNLSSTSDVLRAALRVIGSAPGVGSVSSMFFMISPDKSSVVAFSDCGVLPKPSQDQLVDIAITTADSFQNVTKIEPKIAMLSFSTKGSVSHDLVSPMRDATKLVREKRPDLLIEGELQFDAAFCADVAAKKIPDNALNGCANIFVFPDLNAGNIGYKIAQRMGGYSAIGPMIQGLAKPIHDLSRGCSAQDIIEVAVVGAKMSFCSNNC